MVSTRAGSIFAVLMLVACGGASEGAPAAEGKAAPEEVAAAKADASVPGDPLLTRAREGVRGGALPSEVEAELLASTAPEHARARRVLLAMAEPAEAAESDASADAEIAPPPIVPPASQDTTAPVPAPKTSSGTSSTSSSPRPTPTPSAGPSTVGKLALRSNAKGATLTIAGTSSLVVGVANQPSSGIVRLVVEKAKAKASVLSARPNIEGARITGVRQGQGTIQITLKLDPGWSLGSVSPFSGGARVKLRAPG